MMDDTPKKQISIHSVANLSHEQLTHFRSLNIEVLTYENSQHSLVGFLIINGDDDIRQWDQTFKTKNNVRFISWGSPKDIEEFMLSRGVMTIDPKLFDFSKEYRQLMRGHFFRESTLHLQDKFENTFENIAKTNVTHSMKYGYTSDLITAYAHQNNYDIVPIRHYLNSLLLTVSHLKQLGVFTLPVHFEYSCNNDIFALNMTIHAPQVYLEYLLDFFKNDNKSIRRGNLLWESFRSTHFFEIAHFTKSQKLNLMALWFKEQEFSPSLNLYEVHFIKSQWDQEKLNRSSFSLGEDLLDDQNWEELESKPLKDNNLIQLPELKSNSQLVQDSNKLKALMAEVILKKSSGNAETQLEDLTPLEISELLSGEESQALFEELSEEDKKIFTEAINKPANKKNINEQIQVAKENRKAKDSNQELVEMVIENLVETLTEDEAQDILEEEEEKVEKEVLHKIDVNPLISEKKKKKIKEIVETKELNLEHPFMAQALESVLAKEIEETEEEAEAKAEIKAKAKAEARAEAKAEIKAQEKAKIKAKAKAKAIAEGKTEEQFESEFEEEFKEMTEEEFEKEFQEEFEDKFEAEFEEKFEAEANSASVEQPISPEAVKQKLAEINNFIKESLSLKNPKVQRALDAFKDGSASFEEIKGIVQDIQDGKFADVAVEEIRQEIKAAQEVRKKAVKIVKDVINETFPDLTVEQRKIIEEEVIQTIPKGVEPEEFIEEVMQNLEDVLTEEIQKLSGDSDPKEVLQKISSTIREKLNQEKHLVKGQADKKQAIEVVKGQKVEEEDSQIVSGKEEDTENV